VGEDGEITETRQLKSTGFPAYDQKIFREISTWRYRPFLVDGQPETVCTAVTFIYSQS
jgi:outer membrane biosynthesis protein TonB